MIEFASTSEQIVPAPEATVGARALAAEYERSRVEFELDAVHYNQKVVGQLRERGVPDPRHQSRASRVLRAMQGREHASREDRTTLAQWLDQNATDYLNWAPLQLGNKESKLQLDHERLRQNAQHELLGVRQSLEGYAKAHQAELDSLWNLGTLEVPEFFKNAKADYEARLGRECGWMEWITNGTSDIQLQNILEWGAYKVKKEAQDPEFAEKVARAKHGYSRGLAVAHQEGLLNGEKLAQALDKVQNVRITPFHPLSELAGANYIKGEAYAGEEYVQVRQEGSDDCDIYHELSHNVFAGVSLLFDEAITEKLTCYLLEKATAKKQEPSAYHNDIRMLESLYELTGNDLNDQVLLDIAMNGSSYAESYNKLRNAVAKATNYDVLEYLECVYTERPADMQAEVGVDAIVFERELVYDVLEAFKTIFLPAIQNGSWPDPQEMIRAVIGYEQSHQVKNYEHIAFQKLITYMRALPLQESKN